MIFRQVLHPATGCASYVFGCTGRKRLAVVDPHAEHLDDYLAIAESAAAPIVAIFETHVQADHLSGARELAKQTGADVLMHRSAEVDFVHRSLDDADEVELGNDYIRVIHTPGHSADSVCLVVGDRTRGDDPWLIFTGDTLFVGDAGRPDLERDSRAAAAAAALLYRSLERLLQLPDEVEVYPAHFSGSACGRSLSAKPSSTLGYERKHNRHCGSRERPSLSATCWRSCRRPQKSTNGSAPPTESGQPTSSSASAASSRPPSVSLGLRANLPQFALLMLVNAFVGAMVGLERAVVPVLAVRDFKIAASTAVLAFIASFGIVKAFSNLAAGHLSDVLSRKGVLVAGWLFGLPVPLLVLWAPSWGWVIAANALLGVNQGLCWSLTVNMKIDLVGPARRGLALGLNETAGYVSVGLAALLSGPLAVAFGLRRGPFGLAFGIALVGLLVSVLLIRDTRAHVALEARSSNAGLRPGILSPATWRDRNLLACAQVGLVNNLNDAVTWGLLPLLLLSRGLTLGAIATVAGAYALSWGLFQVPAGALSDRWGRRGLILAGMLIQGVALALIPLGSSAPWWLAAAVVMGFGTALVYPTLLAAVSDLAAPERRASAIGVYRLWRDLGYAVGALLAGLIADLAGVPIAIVAVGVLTILSGVAAGLLLVETAPTRLALAASRR